MTDWRLDCPWCPYHVDVNNGAGAGEKAARYMLDHVELAHGRTWTDWLEAGMTDHRRTKPVDLDAIRRIVPTMILAADGTWLAVSGPDAPVRLGAYMATEAEAREQFEHAKERLIAALEHDPTGGDLR